MTDTVRGKTHIKRQTLQNVAVREWFVITHGML